MSAQAQGALARQSHGLAGFAGDQLDDDAPCQGYCPCCCAVHRQAAVAVIHGTQADGCDVSFTAWCCAGCGGKWSGDLYEAAPPAASSPFD